MLALLPAAALGAALALAGRGLWTHLARRSSLPLDAGEYRALVVEFDLALLILDAPCETILYASPAVPRVLGLDARRGSFAAFRASVHADDIESLDAALLNAARPSFRLEIRLGKQGENRWVALKGHEVPRGFLRPARVVLSAEDVTAKKKDELQLVKARDYEVAIGARIQKALLLGEPERGYRRFELATMTIPSQQVDGDFFDFYDRKDEILDFMIGDVKGKGIPAALTGAAAKNAFTRARMDLADELGASRMTVEGIVKQAERLIARKIIGLKTFFTLVYGRVDGERSLFRYLDCGHTSVIHYEAASRRCWRLKGSNMPMGFVGEQDYDAYAVPLGPGDALVLYSDGITEARNAEGEFFGEERLMKLVSSNPGLSAAELLEKIKQIVFEYSAGALSDDVTGIAFRYRGGPEDFADDRSRFPQTLASLRSLRAFFDGRIATRLSGRLDSERLDRISLAIGEAASNILRHNPQDASLACDARFTLAGRWAAFSIYYRGSDYDWHDPTMPPLDRYARGGYGLYLIKQIMDSASIGLGEDGRVRLCMIVSLEDGDGA